MRYTLTRILRGIRHAARAQVAVLLIITVLSGTLMLPQRAEAISVTEIGANLWTNIKTTVESTVSAVSNVTSAAADTLGISKEFTLDSIAYWLAKKALKMVLKSTVNWINSGFQGSPAFIGDLEQFLIDSADEIFGEFINDSDLAFLCSPFQLDIKIALALSYKPELRQEVQCTLSDVVTNVENFLAGDFTQGGLAGLFEVTQNPSNNFFGAQANAKIALRGRLQDGKEREIYQLNWGKGFISSEKCLIVGSGEECTIDMPGETIAQALNFQLSVPGRELIAADEINEIVSALFSQLAFQALKGGMSLLSSSGGSGGGGGPSYLDKIDDPAYDSVSSPSIAQNPMGQATRDEQEYRGFHTDLISRADGILERIEELETPVQGSGDNDPDACTIPSRITTRVTAIRDEAVANQASADANVALLADIQTRLSAGDGASTLSATSTITDYQAALTDLLTLQSSGTLHSAATNARYKFTIDEIKEELTSLSSEVEAACSQEDDNGSRR